VDGDYNFRAERLRLELYHKRVDRLFLCEYDHGDGKGRDLSGWTTDRIERCRA